MPGNKKLILFDIDGTLLRHFVNTARSQWGWKRFIYAAKKVYGIEVTKIPEINFHGLVDRQIFFTMLQPFGVSKAEFDRKFKDAAKAIHEHARIHEPKKVYEVIPEALELLTLIYHKPDRYTLGILTGNVDSMAKWKLRHIGVDPSWFSLFVTSDEFDDRISLAKSVFMKHEKEAGITIQPDKIYIIGDAVGDIRCAHAIGANSIITTTGKHKKEELMGERPTLLVDSLMDERVLSLLGLSR